MAQECGFFNAQMVGGQYDRVYLAEQFAAYFASFIGNGIFGGQMQQLEVIANNPPNMTVTVLSGKGWINGWWYRNTSNLQLQISVADGVLSRIDSVVLRWDNSRRDMYLHVLRGTPSNSPSIPQVVRNNDYYDLQLCYISIPAGSTNITQAQITDTRLNNAVCGLVTGVVKQIDTTGLFSQYEAAFKEWKSNQQNNYEQWTAGKQNEFNTWYKQKTTTYQSMFESWFNDIKNKLGSDLAGNLQLQINGLVNKSNNIERIVTIEVKQSGFTNTLPHKIRVNVSGIKSTDRPEVTQFLPTNVTDVNGVKNQLKSASFVDRVVTYDGYVEIFCYRRKPFVDFFLNLKGVSNG